MKNTIILFFKGMLMGIADIIPGVSGGTIALLTGIYIPLIKAITSINLINIRYLFLGKVTLFCSIINLPLCICVIAGIASSILLFSNIIHYLLNNYTVLLLAFFLGLVIGAIFILVRQTDKWNIKMLLVFILSLLACYMLINYINISLQPNYIGFFISGYVAICAMILPGISGSLLLVILGMYETIILAIKELQIINISLFILGASCSLLSFSHVIKWLFNRYQKLLMVGMAGIMVGSVNKLWPWQLKNLDDTTSDGKTFNLMPNMYHQISGAEVYLYSAISMILVGFICICFIHFLSNSVSDNKFIDKE